MKGSYNFTKEEIKKVENDILFEINRYYPNFNSTNTIKLQIFGNLSKTKFSNCLNFHDHDCLNINTGNKCKYHSTTYCREAYFIRTLKRKIDNQELNINTLPKNANTADLYKIAFDGKQIKPEETTPPDKVDATKKSMDLVAKFLGISNFQEYCKKNNFETLKEKPKKNINDFKATNENYATKFPELLDNIWYFYHFDFKEDNSEKAICRLVIDFNHNEKERIYIYNVDGFNFSGNFGNTNLLDRGIIDCSLNSKLGNIDKQLYLLFRYIPCEEKVDTLMGLFMENSSNGSLINGTFILQKSALSRKAINTIKRKVKSIKISEARRNNIPETITQYFSDKWKNISKTPEKSLQTDKALKKWLQEQQGKNSKPDKVIWNPDSKYHLFISAPIKSLKGGEKSFNQTKVEVIQICEKLKNKSIQTGSGKKVIKEIYYAPFKKQINFNNYDPTFNLKQEFKNIAESNIFILILHQYNKMEDFEYPSSCFVEAGIALGNNIPVIIVCNEDKILPNFLRSNNEKIYRLYKSPGIMKDTDSIANWITEKIEEILIN